jgi:signal transduction histidine kinase
MKLWFRGKRGGFLAFVLIAALVAGGLGWVTYAAWHLEQDQLAARADAELHTTLRLALWRLDSFMAPELAREASRPFAHYSAVFAPGPTFSRTGRRLVPGSFLELSPLIDADLPSWMLLHFSTSKETGWWSPQVLSASLRQRLEKITPLPPADAGSRSRLLQDLSHTITTDDLMAMVKRQEKDLVKQREKESNSPDLAQGGQNQARKDVPWMAQTPQQQSLSEFTNRANYSNLNAVNAGSPLTPFNAFFGPVSANGESLLASSVAIVPQGVAVNPGPMTVLWLPAESTGKHLIMARRVDVGNRSVCQGILLDWPVLRETLRQRIEDLFPDGRLEPMLATTPPHPERTMTTLPLELDPQPVLLAAAGWTPLRIGLALAWAAALVALLAVGLGGWSLIDFSERRIRFVSTVTHELRTPLTTLRLYADMLMSGVIKDEKHREEYLRTLNDETERLARLVANVLDFSRLENNRPRLEKTAIPLDELMGRIEAAWRQRCRDAGKELVLENGHERGAVLVTDVKLLEQILGNLLDNACKYSKGAADPKLWLRVRREGDHVHFEVEDRGPGVPRRERRAIFRVFGRGRDADVTAGGVGLGLALARRWAHLLGGRLILDSPRDSSGACFRLELKAEG